jgi:hypothetical protein
MIEHWTCSSCGKEITYIDSEGKIQHRTHFDITRSNKELETCEEEINVAEENLKMERQLCEKCFLKALNESKTLGKLFYDAITEKFLY